MKRLFFSLACLLVVSPALATHNILFEPVSDATSYTCTAYERHRQLAHPDLGLSDDRLVTSGPIYSLTSWASVTCTVIGAFPGSNGGVYYAQIPTATLDPNTPGLQVIACITSVGANGATSPCTDAQNFSPTNPSRVLEGGQTSAPIANASDQ